MLGIVLKDKRGLGVRSGGCSISSGKFVGNVEWETAQMHCDGEKRNVGREN
jgi:hypothetical protein